MSAFHHEFRLPDVKEIDILQLVVEHAEDPRLGEFWTDLLRNRPGTAQFIKNMCRQKAGDDDALYEKMIVAALETALTLGVAATRENFNLIIPDVSDDGDESAPLQAEQRADQ